MGGTHSLAVARPGTEVRFTGKSHTVHTMTSLIFPTGAAGMLEGIVMTGEHPIGTGMMPDASKYYVSNFLSNTITVIDTATGPSSQ